MSKIFYPLYPFGKLDAQAEAVLYEISKSDAKPLTALSLQEARDSFLEKSWLGNPIENIQIRNFTIDTGDYNIPIRIYSPTTDSTFPILVFFHGGGFVLGTLDEFDPFCTYLAEGASCMVISVGYRLAPENKYPAAVEDVKTAINWIGRNAVQLNGDVSRIAVAGDSAGANLAVVAALSARDNSFPSIIYQVLISPWVDLSSTGRKSYKYFGDGLWLSTQNIIWYRDHYLANKEQAKINLVSPMLAKNLSGLPPALIITAEFDVLRDEGEAFANRLKDEDINVQCSRYNGMLHDFVVLPGLFDKAKDAIEEICSSLRKVFNAK